MSADKILDKISRDAAEESDAILKSAEERAALIRQTILAEAQESVEGIKRQSEAEVQELERRQMLIAGLEARKNTLAAKRRVLDEAFLQALEELCALSGERWERLVTRLVLENSMTGQERLRVPAADRERYENGFLAKLNAALRDSGRHGELTLDETPSACRGGIQLIGEASDVNASFEALVRAAREDCEREVSALLFEAEVQ